MRQELKKVNYDLNWAIVNEANAEVNCQALIDECTMPVFQDTKEMDAWGKHKGSKDDIFVYDAKGKLFIYLPVNGTQNTNLSDDKAYAAVKQLVIDATKVK